MSQGFIGTIGFIKGQEIIKGTVDNSWGPGEVIFLGDLIPVMTANDKPSGICTSSSVYSASYDAYKAFRGTGSSAQGEEDADLTVTYTWPTTQAKGTFKCSFRTPHHYAPNAPNTMTVYLQKTDNSWVSIWTQTNIASKVNDLYESNEITTDYNFKAIKFEGLKRTPTSECSFGACQLTRLK